MLFRSELTTGNTIIMGRRTYEEIGFPLPNRETIVISQTVHYESEHCTTVDSLHKALQIATTKDIFIAGGARLYEESLPLAECLYITEIADSFEGDVYFPIFDENNFIKTIEHEIQGDVCYRYVTYQRK